VAARRRRPFTGLLVKPVYTADAKARGLRATLAAPPDESDVKAHILAEISARYTELDKFFSLKSNSQNIWEQRAKALLAYKFNIPQSWEHLARYLTHRYVPGFSLKGPGASKRGAPVEWNFEQLAQVFADVESLKKQTGKKVSEVCKMLTNGTEKRYVKRWGLYRSKPNSLRKAYAKAKKLRLQNFMFELHLCGPEALMRAKRIDPIQAAIDRHALR
jgi:hypothetical protein